MDKKYDWEKVYIEYVTGADSIKKLAEKYGIPTATVQARATREAWGQQRRIFKDKTREKTADKIASSMARKLKKEFNIATKLSKILADALKDPEQFYRYTTTDGKETVETVLKALNTGRLSQTAKALKDLSEIKKLTGDMVSEIESRRYAAGADDGGESGVIILPEVNE